MSEPTRTPEARRRRLSAMLRENRSVSVADAARRFGVSTMTIRRDLKALEHSEPLVRCYGGALPARRISFEFEFAERRQRHLAEKRKIGAEAARRVRAGQTIILDTGTTTLEAARALVSTGTPCRVITSSLAIASVLWGHELVDLTLLGGQVRKGSPDLVGPATEILLENLTADLAMLGSDGIDPERGSFAGDLETARVAQQMARSAAARIVLADSSKLAGPGAARYLKAAEIDELITDSRADPKALRRLRAKGVRVSTV